MLVERQIILNCDYTIENYYKTFSEMGLQKSGLVWVKETLMLCAISSVSRGHHQGQTGTVHLAPSHNSHY